MSRTTVYAKMSILSVDEAISVFDAMMTTNGYRHVIYKGEDLWSAGDAVFSGLRCFSYMFDDKNMIIQGWIADALGNESNLDGFVGMIPKKKMKQILQAIVERIN